MTLNEITSTIRNKVADGLSGNISNQAFSIKQLEEEVDIERAAYIQSYIDTGRKINPKYLLQTVDKLTITCMDLAQNVPCGFQSHFDVPAVKIHPIAATFDDSAVEYFGLMNKQEGFIVYYDTDSMALHKYRVKTKHLPFIWIDTTPDSDGYMTAFLMNAGKYSTLKYLSMRSIFEHPTRIGANTAGFGDKEYPAPGHIQKVIIKNITEEYIRYYRQLNVMPQPNTQSDPVT